MRAFFSGKKKRIFTSDDVYGLIVGNKDVEYRKFQEHLIVDTKNFRFKKGRENSLLVYEINDITSLVLLNIENQIRKKAQGGGIIKDVAAYFAQSFLNEMAGYHKKNSKKRLMEVLFDDIPVSSLPVSGKTDEDDNFTFLTDENKAKVANTVKQLNGNQQMVIKMRHSNNMSNKEIAQIMGISVDHVKTIHQRAITKLRKLFGIKPQQP